MNIKSVVELHTYSPIKVYNDMLLEKADEVIVHCDNFKKWIVNGTSGENISVIKLSCKNKVSFDLKEIKDNLGIGQRHPVIGSFGFMRDQKGYHEIAMAVKELIPTYPNIMFLLVAPIHEFGSDAYDEKFYRYIGDLGITDRTIIIREYMDDDKLMKVLACADLFVLNYKPSKLGGGNSAAIKTLMRVQRPIITSNTIYFDDMGDEVYKIEDHNPIIIKEAIQKLYDDPALRKGLVDKANKFLEENSWDRNVDRHLQVYSG